MKKLLKISSRNFYDESLIKEYVDTFNDKCNFVLSFLNDSIGKAYI